MEIQLTPEQDSFVRKAIEEGRFQNPQDAVQYAMDIYVERERRRMELIAELQIGDDAIRQGKFSELTEETIPTLIAEITKGCEPKLAEVQCASK